jgi:hypothetical protein
MVKAYPKVAELKDKNGRIPLHIVCGSENDASPDEAYTKGAEMQDKYIYPCHSI